MTGEWDGFYKRECQEKVSPQRRKGEFVLDIQPLSPESMSLVGRVALDKRKGSVKQKVSLSMRGIAMLSKFDDEDPLKK